MHHHLFQFWIIVIALALCALFSSLPLEKFQYEYKKYIYNFNAAPQKHLNRQIEYANDSGAVDILIFDSSNMRVKNKNNINIRKPYYIRDVNNPNILHKYRD